MQFDEVVTGRRSIRGYKSDPVPKELIEKYWLWQCVPRHQ